jgi:hypothetical protein
LDSGYEIAKEKLKADKMTRERWDVRDLRELALLSPKVFHHDAPSICTLHDAP